MDNAIEAIKEFFFDIIGFLVPGMLCLIILKIVFYLPLNLQDSDMLINIVVSYVIGYLIFSLSQIKESWIKELNASTNIPSCLKPASEDQVKGELSHRDTFLMASEIIRKKTIGSKYSLTDFNSFRSFAMSGTPEADKKVYTFMFRAELFNQLHTIAIVVLSLLSVNYCASIFDLTKSLAIQNIHGEWFVLFSISIAVLRKGWKRFYRIAMNIPFSLYIEKFKS